MISLLAMTGCASLESWDWFGLKKSDSQTRPTTKAAPQATASAAPRAADAEDDRAKSIDDKVDRYVRSMNATYDPSFQENDFNSKIRRQSDPRRAGRIREAALRDRQEPPPAEPRPEDLRANESSAVPVGDAASEPRAVEGKSAADPADSRVLDAEDEDPKPALEGKSPATPAQASDRPAGPEAPTSPPAKAPVLTDVTVQSAPPPGDQPTVDPSKRLDTGSPSTPGAGSAAVNAPPALPTVDPFKQRMEEQEALISRDPNNLEEQFRLRMMYLVAGQDDKALAASDGIQSDLQEIMQAQIHSMLAARTSAARDPATWANRQLEAVEALRQAVRARADLVISRLTFCKKIVGFGDYEPIEGPEYPAGQANQILLYVELENFMSARNSAGLYRTLLNVRQSLLTQDGKELWSHRDENIEDLSRQKRQDFFLSLGPRYLPKSLAPGDYVVKVEVEDALARKMNSGSLAFKIVPQPASANR